MASVKGVEVFSTGSPGNGKSYDAGDLNNIVSNFERFSTGPRAILRPTVAIGHEENQPLLENSGLPAVGMPSRFWQQKVKCRSCAGAGKINGQKCPMCLGDKQGQGILMADLVNVPDEIAPLLDNKNYNGVSCEIYDAPPIGIPGRGRMLRRISLLGSELPKIKTLADIPKAKYHSHSERYRIQPVALKLSCVTPLPGGVFRCFSEVSNRGQGRNTFSKERSMDRDEMISKIVELLKQFDDQGLQELLDSLSGTGDTPDLQTKASGGNDTDTPKDAEEFVVSRHCERFAEDFRRMDTDPKDVFSAFKSMRRKNPSLTAAKFLDSTKGIGNTDDTNDTGNTDTDEAAEKEKIAQHYKKYAETFRKIDTTKDDLVSAYSAARKLYPGISAYDFLNQSSKGNRS